MSRRGEKMSRSITEIRESLQQTGDKGAVEAITRVLGLLEEINLSLQEIERESGPSDAFVNPNDGSHRIT